MLKWFISYKHIAVCLEDKSGRVFGQAVVRNALLLSGLKEKHNVPFYAWPKLKINTHITDVEMMWEMIGNDVNEEIV